MTDIAVAGGRRSSTRLVLHQVKYEQLSFWRNPQNAFFTFLFPVIFFVVLAGVFAHAHMYGAVTGVQYYTSTIVAISVMGACYSQLAMVLSFRREQGILKRLRATPAPAWLAFAGLLAHCLIVSLIDVVVIVALGRAYGLAIPHRVDVILVTVVVAAAAFCALGVAVASLISNAEAAPAVVQLIFFPLVFISGSYFNITSSTLNSIAGVFPVRPFNLALLKVFTEGGGYDWRHLGVLTAWGVGGAVVAVRRFRWDPRPE